MPLIVSLAEAGLVACGPTHCALACREPVLGVCVCVCRPLTRALRHRVCVCACLQEKFRTIKLSNAAFQSRVAAVQGALDFMATAGFQVSSCAAALALRRLPGAARVCGEGPSLWTSVQATLYSMARTCVTGHFFRAALALFTCMHASGPPSSILHPLTCMYACTCMQQSEEALTMPRDKVNMDILNGAGAALNEALTNPFFGVL